jgi:hypothetical protein
MEFDPTWSEYRFLLHLRDAFSEEASKDSEWYFRFKTLHRVKVIKVMVKRNHFLFITY